MWNFQKVFLIIVSLFSNLKLRMIIAIIMIIATIYIFLSYEMFAQQLKITSENPRPPSPQHFPEKIHPSSIFTQLSHENFKTCNPPLFCQHWKFFGPSCRKGWWCGGGRWGGGHYALLSKNGLMLHNFGLMK